MTEEVPVKSDIGGIQHQQEQPVTGKTASHSTRSHRQEHPLFPGDLTREEAIRRMEIFHRLTRLIAESNNDLGRLMKSIARLASDLIGDMCVITLLNTDQETYHIAAYHDPDPVVLSLFEATLDEVANIPRDQGWVAGVIASGQPLLLPGIPLDEAVKSAVPSFVEFTRAVGIAGMLIVPIAGRSGVLGTLAMTRHGGRRPYTENDKSFLVEIGYRVGFATETAMQIDSLRKEVGLRVFAVEALAASEERFLSIFRSAASGIKVMDLVGTILETNPAFQVMTGYSERELVAMHFYDIVHPDDLSRALDAFNRLKTGRQPYARLQHRILSKDGSVVWVNTTYAVVKRAAGDPSLALIFGIAENITEQKHAEAELLELKQHLQHNIELDRLRLAQNLHDAPLQELYAVIYKLEEMRLKSDPDSAELLHGTILDIKKTLDGLRATASELRPPSLSRFGLEKAIRSYGEDFQLKHPDIRLKLTLAKDRQFLSEPVRLVLFRVFQESINNVVRHAQASEVQVRFSFDAEEARIEIADNGKGFRVPSNWIAEVRNGHYGLAGMAERVSAAGGTLALESAPNASTTVRAVIPCLEN